MIYKTMSLKDLLIKGGSVNVTITAEELKSAFTEWAAQLKCDQPEESGKTKDLLSREETSAVLNVDKSTLWRWNKTGYLPAVKVGAKVMYRRADIDKVTNN